MHSSIQMHVKFFHDMNQYVCQVAILLGFFMSLIHNSNIPERILFKLNGTKATHYSIQMHINFLGDMIQYGCQAAILLQFFNCLGTKAILHRIQIHVNLFGEMIQYGHQVAILL